MSNIIKYALVVLFSILTLDNCKGQEVESGKLQVTVKGPLNYLSRSNLANIGLEGVFDAPLAFMKISKDKFWVYLSKGGKNDGKHFHIVRVKSTPSEIDVESAKDVPVSGIPDADINKYNGWRGWMMDLYKVNKDEWLALIHYEDQDYGNKEDFKMGLAYSDDGGKSFKNLGFIAHVGVPTNKNKSGKGRNIGSGGMRSDDQYLYIYFNDYQIGHPVHIAVARASKNEIIQHAREGENTKFYKYYQGRWQQPGLGGKSDTVVNTHTHSKIVYNSYLHKWLFFVSGQENTIRMLTSSNPLSFSGKGLIIYRSSKGRMAHYSPHTTNNKRDTVGKEFDLYYNKRPYNYPGQRLRINLDK